MSCVIILLNYNDSAHTAKLAATLNEYQNLDRVIVVDNCSSDDSYSVLKKMAGSKTDVLLSPENGGYAKGNNFGARYAIKQYHPDYIFIANPDTMISEATIGKLTSAMDSNPSYGVLTALVNQGYNVWKLPGFIGMLESLFLIWFNLDKRHIKKKLLRSKNALETVGVVEGSLFLVRTAAYEKAGGLDERTFLYAEEIILSKRMQKAGYKVGVMPHESYDHFHSVSIRKEYKSSKARAFHHFLNSFRLYNKEYLHTNRVQDAIFTFCYGLAYVERVIFDLLKR